MNEYKLDLGRYEKLTEGLHFTRDSGKVIEVQGLIIRGYLPGARIGSICRIHSGLGDASFLAEVVGFKDRSVLMMALNDIHGIALGSRLVLERQIASVRVSEGLLGQVVDGLGHPFDKSLEIEKAIEMPLYRPVRSPLEREPIRNCLDVGVRAINGMLTIGRGQRMSIMAGSGVGKSVLLGMMARYTEADVNVISLIGERGREVREFIENDLGENGMKRSVVVCVTSDQSPLLRVRGAFVAMAIAEYFSSLGKNVLLMMDSVTRFAMAMREVGLSAGEPPSTKGYTPSVFSTLPKLLERAGNFSNEGSITGIYTTLVESDDLNDPIGDAVRSFADGHIVLTRELAHRGHFPSIDILQSASRVMKGITTKKHQAMSTRLRETLAIYKDAEDLINIGAYKAGSNSKIDHAVRLIDSVNQFLRQGVEEGSSFKHSEQQLESLMG